MFSSITYFAVLLCEASVVRFTACDVHPSLWSLAAHSRSAGVIFSKASTAGRSTSPALNLAASDSAPSPAAVHVPRWKVLQRDQRMGGNSDERASFKGKRPGHKSSATLNRLGVLEDSLQGGDLRDAPANLQMETGRRS